MVSQRIERDILIDAPVDIVWAVVTEPEHIGNRFSNSVELDLPPGGRGWELELGEFDEYPGQRTGTPADR